MFRLYFVSLPVKTQALGFLDLTFLERTKGEHLLIPSNYAVYIFIRIYLPILKMQISCEITIFLTYELNLIFPDHMLNTHPCLAQNKTKDNSQRKYKKKPKTTDNK